uniref:Uncharacterized protein n=1 Tax=Schizaphis graminum TaxID=13262 RepID=A0A2S2NLV0_SCHGA
MIIYIFYVSVNHYSLSYHYNIVYIIWTSKIRTKYFTKKKNRYCVGTTTLIWLYDADIVRVACCGPDDRTNPPSLIIKKNYKHARAMNIGRSEVIREIFNAKKISNK